MLLLSNILLRYNFFLIITLIIFSISKGQPKLLPEENIFQTITTNYFEPRIGLSYNPGNGYFKVDAGKAFDLILFDNITNKFSFGTEFFMHALGLNIKEKRLPIDAADGYFGVNINYENISKKLKVRLKVLHNSAHFVDGHEERKINYQPKENYVNDFLDLTIQKYLSNNFYVYSILNYPIIIHPKELHKLNLSFGNEWLINLSNSFLENEVNYFIAYQIKLTPIPKYIGSNHFMTGIKFGKAKETQLKIYFSYYNGENLF